MKKRLLAIAMALVMAMSLLPVSVFAMEGEAEETSPADPVCTCTTKCTEDIVNEACPVCSAEGAELDKVCTPTGETPEPVPEHVAKIGGQLYATLDEAVAAAQDGDTIELLADCETNGIKVSGKTVIIEGNDKTVHFKNKGIAVMEVGVEDQKVSGTLNINNCVLDMNGVANNPEQDGQAILVNFLCTLKLNGVNMVLKPTPGYTGHGIFLHGGGMLDVVNSNVRIADFSGNGASGIYCEEDIISVDVSTKIRFANSVLTISGCCWGGMTVNCVDVLADNSRVSISGNGVNGGRGGYNCYDGTLTITNDSSFIVNNNVGSWGGLFVDTLTVEENSSLEASENTGYAGLTIGGYGMIKDTGVLTLNKNSGNGLWIYKGNTNWIGDCTITGGASVDILANKDSGIYNQGELVMNTGHVERNSTQYTGGGIWNTKEASASIADGVCIYNNHAVTAGDDIYNANAGSITFSKTGEDWRLDGDPDHCTHAIDGWYYDAANVTDAGTGVVTYNRWDAHAAEPRADLFSAFTEEGVANINNVIALKAAHGVIGSISGTVFNDKTRNDIYVAAGETSEDKVFPNVKVTLWKQNGDEWDAAGETKTNKDGRYVFEGLEPGNYQVRIAERPNGMNRDCAVNEDTQGNKFSRQDGGYATEMIEVIADQTAIANAGFYYKSSGGSGGTDPKPPILNTKDHFGYIIGYPVDYFTGEKTDDQTKKPVKPQGNITRAEVATIFFRMLTDEARTEYWSSTNSYTDVPTEAWYNNAVSTLTNAGIIDGYTDGSFRPNGKITRAEFATIAVRFFDSDYNGKDLFPDIDGHWAQDYINQAGDAGIIQGYPDGTFGPQKLITRAEAVTMVNRTLDRHPDQEHFLPDMLVWPDNMDTTKWYYADMQEATNSHEYEMKTNSDGKYEIWTKMLPIRDWEAFEKEWSDAGSAANPGEVVR